jgi:hypothetical protein
MTFVLDCQVKEVQVTVFDCLKNKQVAQEGTAILISCSKMSQNNTKCESYLESISIDFCQTEALKSLKPHLGEIKRGAVQAHGERLVQLFEGCI